MLENTYSEKEPLCMIEKKGFGRGNASTSRTFENVLIAITVTAPNEKRFFECLLDDVNVHFAIVSCNGLQALAHQTSRPEM